MSRDILGDEDRVASWVNALCGIELSDDVVHGLLVEGLVESRIEAEQAGHVEWCHRWVEGCLASGVAARVAAVLGGLAMVLEAGLAAVLEAALAVVVGAALDVVLGAGLTALLEAAFAILLGPCLLGGLGGLHLL